MARKAVNRFALLEDDHVSRSPPDDQTADAHNPFLNQVGDNDNPWQEVRKTRGAPLPPPQQQQPRTLVIRGEKQAPPLRNRTNQQGLADARARQISNSTQSTDASDKSVDPFENWCGVCYVRFPNKSSLLSHVKQVPNHENYCNLCKRVFKDRNGLRNHLDNSLGHETFCNLCLSAFKDSWGLKNHFENNYSVGHEFICLVCLLGFRTKVELRNHLHTGTKHVWCHTCHRKFRNQDERDAHWINTAKHKHCMQPGCDFDAPHAAALAKHHARDHFQCEGCQTIFPSGTKLTLHHETCSFINKCPACGDLIGGRESLADHQQHCFVCVECGFWTEHQGNYQIHLTKHIPAAFSCWACAAPMRTQSSLINHLESGRCPDLPDPSRLTLVLGKWWYSPLYMDLDIHAQIRTGRLNLGEMLRWVNDGSLHPYVCRAGACDKTFAHFSCLVKHVESSACEWTVQRLGLAMLEQEFVEELERGRRDSVVGGR
ncbi:hypothetical protein BDV95DRAFT_505236 [Massariosphaeria phaeospora]|uniref:C2H2-type domain-containing protein n=1 Tax=Massariosphaeria phaeospora TaxID=100035 RepID=A0A7C8MD07_9PLEO|nr:hypothetical protein BDV95DRAFT_505236 [Massariosphaeria phaeospora]